MAAHAFDMGQAAFQPHPCDRTAHGGRGSVQRAPSVHRAPVGYPLLPPALVRRSLSYPAGGVRDCVTPARAGHRRVVAESQFAAGLDLFG